VAAAGEAAAIDWPLPAHNELGADDEHSHYCVVCEGAGGKLTLCDGCCRVYHFKCLGIRSVSRYYNWYCPVCASCVRRLLFCRARARARLCCRRSPAPSLTRSRSPSSSSPRLQLWHDVRVGQRRGGGAPRPRRLPPA